MKRLVLGVALATVVISSCGTDIDLGDRPLFYRGINNLTLLVYDGMTGAPMTGAAVAVQVGPHRIEAAPAEGSNIYTAAQLPSGTFPVFVDADNYLNYTGQIKFDVVAGTNDHVATQLGNRTYLTQVVLLYPNDSVEHDLIVRAYEQQDGTPVKSGRVVAVVDPTVALSGVLGAAEITGGLAAGLGFRPTTITAELTDGTAVIPKNQLAFGATYKIDVFAASNAAGEYLQPLENETYQAGRDFHQVVLFMGPPAQQPIALTASNENGGTQSTLVVTFPYPVQVCSDPLDHAWVATDGTDAEPAETNPVSVSLSDGDRTLTIGYNAGDEDPNANLTVEFSGVQVRVFGASTCSNLFGGIHLRAPAGNPISGKIVVRQD